MDFPAVDRVYSLDEEKIEEYCCTFIGMDVAAHLRIAWQWIQDNPDKRKYHRNMPHFLFGWLQRQYSKMKPDDDKLSYHQPYKNKRGDSYIALLRRQFGDKYEPRELLLKSFQAELNLCQKCSMPFSLKHLRHRLVRYLVSEAGLTEEEAVEEAQGLAVEF